MDKLKMHSINKVDDNIEKIGKLFPNCLTERKNEQGEVEYAIDFDTLRQELSSVIVEGNEERYQFTWPDKRKSILLANAPIARTLRPVRDDEPAQIKDEEGKVIGEYTRTGSVDFDSTENIYIEGDNLDVLKLMQETYLGKIKMIYIDPPYNTGNDFVYEDNFAKNADEYLNNSGQFDEEGNRLVKNLDSNGRFHTDWLNMIYPRLKVAKNILADDGVIFISIDDNENHNLKKLCDEIFGETNFISDITVVNNLKGRNDKKYIARANERLLMYVKSQEFEEQGLKLPEARMTEFSYENEEGKFRLLGLRKRGGADTRILRPNMFYPFYVNPLDLSVSLNKTTKHIVEVYPYKSDSTEGCWRWGKETAQSKVTQLVSKKVGASERYDIFEIDYLESDGELRRIKPKSVMAGTDYSTDKATKQYRKLMGKIDFSSPKSVEFMKDLVDYSTDKDNGSCILDFFSGSATTAHAVMELNSEDNGNRKYIMVQIPERTDSKSDQYKAGYKNICEIGKERIRRAGAMLKEEIEKEPPRLDEENKKVPDIGFRVLKLDNTNMKDVYYNPTEYTPTLFDSLTDNIKEDRTPEDLLFQVMLDLGVLLSSKIEESVIDGKKVYSVADGFLIACFDDNVTDDTVKAIAQQHPYYAVFRDSSYASDSVATNFEQIFATYSPDTVRKVL